MKKLFVAGTLMLMFGAVSAFAQTTGSGTLTATATVQGSLQLVFDSNASGPALTGTGTSNATLAFGTIQAYGGSLATGVSRTAGASSFTVSAPFDVFVSKANVTSTGYTLTANVTDATNTWAIGATAINGGGTVTTAGTYGADNPFTLNLTVPYSSAAGSISKAISFTATAN